MSKAKDKRIRTGKLPLRKGTKRAYRSGIGMSILRRNGLRKQQEKAITMNLANLVAKAEKEESNEQA